jgi:ABC-type Zn uptake system ZnuABC Zn-binding protein ZnuA/ABC-type Mn2+/Zn2+ transport system permease subunit
MLDPFSTPFMQQALWEVLLLSVGAGVLGTWIVLRGLSFFAHGVAAATFPGLVVASGVGFAGPLGALGTAVVFAVTTGRLDTRDGRSDHSTTTAMLLVGALAAGVILASNVFPAAVNVNSLLFGSLLLIEDRDLWIAGIASLVVVVASLLLGSRWLAVGFDRPAARALGVRAGRSDAALLVLVALMAIAALTAVGSLLAAALMVIPAATIRPWIRSMLRWQIASVVLTALVGVGGLWLSARTNAPPGASIAVLSGVLFAMSVLSRAAVRRPSSRRRLPAVVTAVVALAGLGLAGCGSDDDASSASAGSGAGEQVAVVATTAPVADLVRNVGGDAVSVHQMLSPGTDPHEYEPRPKDITESADATVVFASGLGFDGWIDDVLKQAGNDADVVRLGDDVPELLPAAGDDDHADHDHGDEADERDHAHELETAGEHAEHADEHAGHDHGDGEHDPHWWHDPENAIAATDRIRDALIAANPGAKDAITANAAAYRAKLEKLDDGVERCFASVPERERKIVTSHDALGYFAEAYDITVVGAVIPSQTTRAQASAADVDRLAREIREQGVRAIFPESSVNPKVAQALAKETGVTAEHTLYGDGLGESGSDGATYLGMIAHNADAIMRGLTGGERGCTIEGL